MMKLLAFSIGGNGSPTYTITLPGGLGGAGTVDLPTLVRNSLTILLSVAILLAFFFIVFGGFKWMLSQGDKKQLDEAQKTITFAVIGLVLVLLSFFILTLIGFLFQVPLISK